ncbi:MAG: hypothetical protein GVY18_12580, partial [Bacteroidetes bacterium]|nr:hypothetical protein [Bacteroidota bacterium]
EYPSQFITTRYEDLVQRPEEEVQRLCHFAGVPYDSAMLDVHGGIPADWSAKKQTSGVRKNSAGRWKRGLASGEVRVCQLAAHRQMRAVGYPPAPVPAKGHIEAVPLLIRSTFAFLSRLYGRWKLGGTAFVLEVLRGYLHRLGKLLRLGK